MLCPGLPEPDRVRSPSVTKYLENRSDGLRSAGTAARSRRTRRIKPGTTEGKRTTNGDGRSFFTASRGGGAGNRIVAGATSRDPTGANGVTGDEVKAPIGPVGDRSIPLEDDSGTIRASRRRALVRALTSAMNDGVTFGDLALAQSALAALAARAERNPVQGIASRTGLPPAARPKSGPGERPSVRRGGSIRRSVRFRR